jgi:hypothetical protein
MDGDACVRCCLSRNQSPERDCGFERPPRVSIVEGPGDSHVVYRGHMSRFFPCVVVLRRLHCSFHPVLLFWNFGIGVDDDPWSRVEWWGRKLYRVTKLTVEGTFLWTHAKARVMRPSVESATNQCLLSIFFRVMGLTRWIPTIILCLRFARTKLFGS